MDEDGPAVETLELLDRYTCAVLAATTDGPTPAKYVQAAFDVPGSTLYRRLPELVEQGLVTEEMEIDADGNHRQAYLNRVERVELDFDGGGARLTVSLAGEDDPLVHEFRPE